MWACYWEGPSELAVCVPPNLTPSHLSCTGELAGLRQQMAAAEEKAALDKELTAQKLLQTEREALYSLRDPMHCIACQPPLSMGFSRQEQRSGLPFPSPGHLCGMSLRTVSCGWRWADQDSETSLRVFVDQGSRKHSLFAKPLLQPRASQFRGFRGREPHSLRARTEERKMGS